MTFREALEKLTITSDPATHPEVAIILGTGWGDAFVAEVAVELKDIEGFEGLSTLAGHRRLLMVGSMAGRRYIALSGRIHLNEGHGQAIADLVREQVSILLSAGTRVKTLVLTNAAGSLSDHIQVGDIVVADGFISLFAPAMPLKTGEFVSPDDALSSELQNIAMESAFHAGLITHLGGYAMVRGPFFEGRTYDKPILRQFGASAVGMSTLPEACVAATRGAQVLALSFITNTDSEEHSHETNLERANDKANQLGLYLEEIIRRLPA